VGGSDDQVDGDLERALDRFVPVARRHVGFRSVHFSRDRHPHLGTSGFSYPTWARFYPSGTPQRRFLR
jgi:hypothetical protein